MSLSVNYTKVAGKTRAHLSGAQNGIPSLAFKYDIRMGVPVSDKHSSLLRYGIIYARKKFMIQASGVNVAVTDGGENKLER